MRNLCFSLIALLIIFKFFISLKSKKKILDRLIQATLMHFLSPVLMSLTHYWLNEFENRLGISSNILRHHQHVLHFRVCKLVCAFYVVDVKKLHAKLETRKHNISLALFFALHLKS